MTFTELRERTGLPACFIEELLLNDFRPRTDWAKHLEWERTAKQVIETRERLNTDAPLDSSPWVCLWVTVQFYYPNPFREVARIEVEPRDWPRISFIEREGELWEVTGGRVANGRVVGGVTQPLAFWEWRWSCHRNTEMARHFRGVHDEWGCRPCRQIECLKDNARSTYGICGRCRKAFGLVCDRGDEVIPRHQCVSQWMPETHPEKVIDPDQALLVGLAK